MPNARNKHTCHPLVRDHIKHNSCGGGKRNGSTRSGLFLNSFSSSLQPFKNETEYNICYNLHRDFERDNVPKRSKIPQASIPNKALVERPPIVSPPPLPKPKDRIERLMNKNITKSFTECNDIIKELHEYNKLLNSLVESIEEEEEKKKQLNQNVVLVLTSSMKLI